MLSVVSGGRAVSTIGILCDRKALIYFAFSKIPVERAGYAGLTILFPFSANLWNL